MTKNSLMFQEAGEGASAVSRMLAANGAAIATLGAVLRADSPKLVISCARGSSDHAATFAKYLIETRLQIPVTSMSPSIISIYGKAPIADQALCLAISQSGRSPDLIAATSAIKASGAGVVTVTNDVSAPLADLADVVVGLSAGPELSVAATKSYIASLAAIVAIVAHWSEDEALLAASAALPAQLEQAWACDWWPLVDALSNVDNLFVIGRGIGLGVAQEAALKFKETCGLHAEAFSAAEVKHGPMALIGRGFPVLVFRQNDETAEGIDALVADLVARGGCVMVAGGSVPGAVTLPVIDANPVLEPILQVQSLYRAIEALSRRRGMDPDAPPYLQKVTRTL